jgi:hypothetical protein
MGIKKAGKRLLKLGQKAAKTLGREGKKRVEEFFANAIEILERELEKQRGATPSKKPTGKATARPRRRAEAVRRATRAKPRTEAVRPMTKAPRAAQRPRRPAATRAPVRAPGPATPEPHATAPAAQIAPRNGTEDPQVP